MGVTYTIMDGELLSENRSGTQRQYVPDPLGSTVALLDTTTAIAKSYSYWSYGGVQSGDTSATKYLFGGTTGGRRQVNGDIDFRYREAAPPKGRWTTIDPFWPYFAAYSFANNSPTTESDPYGLYCRPKTCSELFNELGEESHKVIRDCIKKYPNPKDEDKLTDCINDGLKGKAKETYWWWLACVLGNRSMGKGSGDPNPCAEPVDCIACCGGAARACQLRCVSEKSFWKPWAYATCLESCRAKESSCVSTCDHGQSENPWPGPVKGEPPVTKK